MFEVESGGCGTEAARAESLSVVLSWLGTILACGGAVGWCLHREGIFSKLGPFRGCLLLLYDWMKVLLYSRDDYPGHRILVDGNGCGWTSISRIALFGKL